MAFIQSLVNKGLAKPVSFSDISNPNYEGVPPRKVGWGISSLTVTTLEISTNLSLLKEHVEIVLSRIEGLKYKWDNAKCLWFLEYGTEPMENKYKGKEHRQITMGKFAALQAASDSITRFPHLIDHDDDVHDDYHEYMRWCKMELRVYTDTVKGCFFVHFSRMTGDASTHWNIWPIIRTYFQENAIFIPRSSFLKFVEGIEYDKTNHIHRYLLDDMIIRELCTF
jgi:hypothetical protein